MSARRGLAWAAPRLALWLLVMLSISASAWVCDDAFITLRSVDNLIEGRGLTFNPGWRVQSFTHPAWMLLLVATRLLVREPFFALLALGLVCSGAAYGLLLARTRRLAAALAVVLCIMGSRALVEYGTSGLENPLLHLLIALAVGTADSKADARAVGRAVLLCSCAALCRPDAVLLLGPLALGSVVAGRGIPRRAGAIALGLTPVVVWTAFAIFYFGHPFPNTALAKLGGVPASQRWGQGMVYLWTSVQRDPGTGLLCLIGLSAPWLDLRDTSSPRVALRWLSLGCVLHLGYVVWIGGDFMEGRFLSAPAFVGLAALAVLADVPGDRSKAMLGLAGAVSLAALFGARHPLRPRAGWADKPHVDRGVADERAHYREAASLHALRRDAPVAGQLPRHRWRKLGEAGPPGDARVAVFSTMGYYAYFADPGVHVVDGFALADPLLARLPALKRLVFRPGHSSRPVPDGYLDTLESGTNQLVDPALQALYDDLERVHAGPLFGAGRARAMWRVWTRRHPIDRERYRLSERRSRAATRIIRRKNGHLTIRDAGVVLEMTPGVPVRTEINPGRYDIGCVGGALRRVHIGGATDQLVPLDDVPACPELLIEPQDMLGRRSTELVLSELGR